jgi:hypothetical protein
LLMCPLFCPSGKICRKAALCSITAAPLIFRPNDSN